MEQIHDINDQHMALKLGPKLVLSQVSLSRNVALLLYHDYICLQHGWISDLPSDLPSDPFQGVN